MQRIHNKTKFFNFYGFLSDSFGGVLVAAKYFLSKNSLFYKIENSQFMFLSTSKKTATKTF